MHIDIILDAREPAAALAELGVLAERAGVRGVWVSSLLDSRDPFANLTRLAEDTSALLLGPVAVNPFDTHPVRIAASLLTLNEFARGRARIVIGGGGEALEALDIQPARRVRAVAECVDIIRAAASGEVVDYPGELYRVSRLRFGWVKSAAPALHVGASMPQMLAMAARVADGSMMSDMPVALAAQAIATLDAGLARQNRSRPGFATNAFAAWHVYADRAQAEAEARQWLVLRGIFRPWLLREFLSEADTELVMNSRDAFWQAFFARRPEVEGVPDAILQALVDNITLTGTPDSLDSLIKKLQAYAEAGLESISLRLYADPRWGVRRGGRRCGG